MEWINTAIRSVWTNVGEIPDSVSGIPFAKLTKGERELCQVFLSSEVYIAQHQCQATGPRLQPVGLGRGTR